MQPMRPIPATAAAVAATVALAAVGLVAKQQASWVDAIGLTVAFVWFRWLFVHGKLSSGYTDPAIEQNRERRAQRREARRRRKDG